MMPCKSSSVEASVQDMGSILIYIFIFICVYEIYYLIVGTATLLQFICVIVYKISNSMHIHIEEIPQSTKLARKFMLIVFLALMVTVYATRNVVFDDTEPNQIGSIKKKAHFQPSLAGSKSGKKLKESDKDLISMVKKQGKDTLLNDKSPKSSDKFKVKQVNQKNNKNQGKIKTSLADAFVQANSKSLSVNKKEDKKSKNLLKLNIKQKKSQQMKLDQNKQPKQKSKNKGKDIKLQPAINRVKTGTQSIKQRINSKIKQAGKTKPLLKISKLDNTKKQLKEKSDQILVSISDKLSEKQQKLKGVVQDVKNKVKSSGNAIKQKIQTAKNSVKKSLSSKRNGNDKNNKKGGKANNKKEERNKEVQQQQQDLKKGLSEKTVRQSVFVPKAKRQKNAETKVTKKATSKQSKPTKKQVKISKKSKFPPNQKKSIKTVVTILQQEKAKK